MIFRAVQEKVKVVEIIPGKGSGKLKHRVLAMLNQPHLKKFYRSVEADASNEGRVLVHFCTPVVSARCRRRSSSRPCDLLNRRDLAHAGHDDQSGHASQDLGM